MKENFDISLLNVLKYEGKFVNNPLDKGGPTNLGITLSTLKSFFEDYDYGDLDGDGDVDIDDIKQLDTQEETSPVYKKYYWDRLKLDYIPSGIDFLLFDFGVNSGPKNAVKILQKSLNNQGCNLEVDGVLGNNTISNISLADKNLLIKDMLDERKFFYLGIVENNPKQGVFLKGWLNRLKQISIDVLEVV
jgi:lysozyme family protein